MKKPRPSGPPRGFIPANNVVRPVKENGNGERHFSDAPATRFGEAPISLTQKWLDRLFYISRSMTHEISAADFAELRELLEKLRVERDSKQFPKEP